MSPDLVALLYLVAGVLFILALRGLSSPETSRQGNYLGMAGMAIAVVTTLAVARPETALTWAMILGGIAIGGGIGAVIARRIPMTAMPELVAAFHSLVGLAAVLVAAAAFYAPEAFGIGTPGAIHTQSLIEMSLGVGNRRHHLHRLDHRLPEAVGAHVGQADPPARAACPQYRPRARAGRLRRDVLPRTGAGLFLGDRRAVVPARRPHHRADRRRRHAGGDLDAQLLFGMGGGRHRLHLGNTALIITGALVGSSGAILSYIMCKGMNRSFISVILGGFGGEVAGPAAGAEQKPVKLGSAEDAAFLMKNASKVIIVPGYGMAVAQAQHALREMADGLKKAGVEVKYAIHPVAGRMPGHMNVLLAEANVPYDEVFELEDINSEFAQADVAYVIGANDVTNPAAEDDPSSPIYGMPVLQVWKAGTVLFNKRSLASGYAGIDNPLFYRDNTMMVLGDAKKMTESIVKAM